LPRDLLTWEKAAKVNPLHWVGHYPLDLKRIKMEAMILARRLNFSRKHILLDMGCGIGLYNIFWSKVVREQILVDVSESILRMAKTFLGKSGANVHFINCDVRHLPIRDECIYRCICLGVLKHLERNPISTFQAVREAGRTLKVGGKLYVSDLNIDFHVNALVQRLIDFFRRMLGIFCVDVYFYRREDFEVIPTLLDKGKVIYQTYGWRFPLSDALVNISPLRIRRALELLFKSKPRHLLSPTIVMYLYSNVELIYEKG
jgi:ubiquinone/menaquinone biosynthesis C-methylase UbiE